MMNVVDTVNILIAIYVATVFCEAALWVAPKLYTAYMLRQERAFLTRWYASEQARFERACTFPQCYTPCKFCLRGDK